MKIADYTDSPLKLYFAETSPHENQCRFYTVPQVFCDLCELFVSFVVKKRKHGFNGESVLHLVKQLFCDFFCQNIPVIIAYDHFTAFFFKSFPRLPVIKHKNDLVT